MSTTTIKLQYSEDIRRVTIPDKEKFTFEQLTSKIQSTYKNIPEGWKSIFVKYLDDEGDLVTVTSTEELQESFVSFSKKVSTLKLFISFNYPLVPKEINNNNVTCDVSDAPKPIQKFRQLHCLGIQNLENKDFVAARECFQEQLQYCKSEWQQRIPYYNIACCESLLGNLTTAFEFLDKSVACGFKNRKKLIADPDLINLREISSEKFQTLIDGIKTRKDDDNSCPEREGRGRGCWRKFMNNNNGAENNTGCPVTSGDRDQKPWRKKFCRENKHCDNNEKADNVTSKHEESKTPAQPENLAKAEEITKLNVEQPQVPIISETPEVKNDEPKTIKLVKKNSFGRKLEALAEMGFTDKEKNVKALVAAHGNPRIAVSFLLETGQ